MVDLAGPSIIVSLGRKIAVRICARQQKAVYLSVMIRPRCEMSQEAACIPLRSYLKVLKLKDKLRITCRKGMHPAFLLQPLVLKPRNGLANLTQTGPSLPHR